MPDGTPKMHFEGFNFYLYLFRLANVSSRSAMRLSVTLDLISFDDVAYLLVKAHLDGPLVDRPSVFKSKRYGGIAICSKRHDK